MSSNYIKIIGDELWFQGVKIGTLHTEGVPPSSAAAVRSHLTRLFNEGPVKDWRP
jgi:hypothetical protein